MILEPLAIPGPLRLKPQPHADARGFFARLFCEEELAKAGAPFRAHQINLSRNNAAFTLRGMHFQPAPHAEAKIIRVSQGRIQDVLVDYRAGSPTFLQHVSANLDAQTGEALYVPEGFAHGFLTLEPDTDVLYLMGKPYTPGHAAGLRWNDPALAIDWLAEPAILNEADRTWPLL